MRSPAIAPTKKTKQFGISVYDRVYDTVSAEARKRGYTPTGFATLLFEAAFTARFGNSGDVELDRVVAASLLLHGCGIDFPTIAKSLGASEETVEKIVNAWLSLSQSGGEVAA